jgi:formate-dependent nitrite reductase membrane component NrfD
MEEITMANDESSIGHRVPDAAKEKRIAELRREAETVGRVEAPGVRPAGAPFPVSGRLPEASAESGYYGLPLVKEPTWIWTVPVYFFVGGAAGAAAVIAAVARWTRGETPLVRDARRIAIAGGALSPVLLIADLGRPARFLNMLRVIKLQSPMSVGVWLLVTFNTAVDAASLLRAAGDASERRVLRAAIKAAADAAEITGALLGGAVATYTGVLVGVSTVPVWARNVRLLPFHFGASGFAAASCALELVHDDPALHRIGLTTSAAETAVGVLLEADRGRGQEPVHHGLGGRLTRVAGLLSGPAALAVRILGGRSRRGRRAAAVLSLAGTLMTRFAWLEAGKQSARDPREAMGLARA